MFDQTKHCTTSKISASSFWGSKAFSNPWPVFLYAMVLKKITCEIICQLIRSAATRTLFLRGQNLFLGGAKIFGLVYFFPSSLLISKKKVISPNCSIYLLVFCRFSKKKPPSWNCRQGKGSLGRHGGHFRGAEFLFRGRRPFCSPVVAALLIRLCPKHDNISGRNRISTVLQRLTIFLSHAKCFVSILLQSAVLNLL